MRITTFILPIFIGFACWAANGLCQNLPTYTLIPNNDVGLIEYPNSEKWGQAISDIDYNGWLDIYLVRWRNHQDQFSYIFLNNEGRFEDFTDQTPIKSIEQNIVFVRSLSIVDYDSDGDRDIFFCSEDSMYLLQNNDMVFTNIADSVGLIAQRPPGLIPRWDYNMGAWADFDLDGDLDLLVEQTNYPNLYLYRNDDGIFTDVAEEYGLVNINPSKTDWDGGTSFSRLHWVDFDMDGDQDISTGPKLFRNDGNTFTEVSELLGFTPSLPIQNSEWFDYDNDGDLDFLKTCNYPDDPGCVMELWENQDSMFVDVSFDVIDYQGLLNLSRGISVGDFDNDGDQDLWLCYNQDEVLNAVMLNEELEPGVRIFENVADRIGMYVVYLGPGLWTDTKGGTFMDYDRDGFLDIYIPETSDNQLLWHNEGNNNNWVGFILEGTESNKEAIGAKVTLYAGGQRQLRYRKCPDGWNRQDMPWIHFGLGQNSKIDSVVIHWPMGMKEVLTNVSINQYHKIKEGEASTQIQANNPTMPTEYRLKQNFPNPFNPQTTISYSVPNGGEVQLIIFNLNGELVRKFVYWHASAGSYRVVWDGRNENGENMPSGVYIYKLMTEDFIAIHKMLLIK